MRGIVVVALAVTFGATMPACTSTEPEPQVTTLPVTRSPMKTMAQLEIGDHLETTAWVVSLPDTRATVIDDMDLPREGLLVLGQRPDGLHKSYVVHISGTIDTFSYDRFAEAYALTNPVAYAAFSNKKCLVADRIVSWA